MSSLPALVSASTAGAVGIALFLVALLDEPLDRRPRRPVPLAVSIGAWSLSGVATFVLATHGHRLAAVAAGGLAACGAAGVVALLRARPRDDDDGAGGGETDAGPPSSPGGDAVDWPAFERAFWDHVDERAGRPASA